jgi:outer membrane protein
MRTRNLAVVILALSINIKALAQTTPITVTVRSAIEMALANNYSLKADSLNMAVAAYQANALKSSLLPHLNYNSKAEYNPAIASTMLPGQYVGQPSKEYVPVQFGTRYNMGSGIEASYNLFRKDLRLQVAAAGMNTGIAKTKNEMTREELVFQVAGLFYSLQTNAELIRTTTHDYQNMVEIVRIAKAQLDNGVLKRIDYESLQINTANKQSYLNQLETQYKDQLAYFNYLLGLPADNLTDIDANLPASIQYTAADRSIMQRADIRLSYQMIQQKEIELKSITAENKPQISTYARLNYQSQFNKTGDINNKDYWYKSSTIGISTTIPLFDGYRRKNRMNQAKTELHQLRLRQEQTKQSANTEQVRAWTTFNNDNRQYQITKENLGLAERVFVSRKALYTEGVSSLIELLDAEKELSNSRNLYIQAMINVQTSLMNIHKANGTLLTEFINSL